MKYHYNRAKHAGDRTRTWVGLGPWVGLALLVGRLLSPPLWAGEPKQAEFTGTCRLATESTAKAEGSGGELKRYEFTGTEMAVPIKLLFYTNSDETANTAAHTVFRRIHYLNTLFSDYHGSSEVRRLCDNGVTRVPVRIPLGWLDVFSYYRLYCRHP